MCLDTVAGIWTRSRVMLGSFRNLSTLFIINKHTLARVYTGVASTMDQHQQENSCSCQQRFPKMYHENYLTCLQKISSEARGFENGIDNHLFPKLNQKLKELLGRVIDQIICVSELIKTFLEPVSDHTDSYYKIFLAMCLLLLILFKSNLEVQVDRIIIFYLIFLDLIKY